MESLYKVIPKTYLPIEYGGENGNINDILNYWEHKLIEYKSYFEEDKLYGTDENLRCNSMEHLETSFGAQGSFRKLEVD